MPPSAVQGFVALKGFVSCVRCCGWLLDRAVAHTCPAPPAPQVLPERSVRLGDASMRQVSVLLDAEGRIAPASGSEAKDPEASLLLDAPAGTPAMNTAEPQKSGRLGEERGWGATHCCRLVIGCRLVGLCL